jgi:hypothetical protein
VLRSQAIGFTERSESSSVQNSGRDNS